MGVTRVDSEPASPGGRAAVPHSLGLTTLESEIAVDALPVTGELPAWLEGSLIRTGPARWETGGRSLNHWFDGLAMLHRFAFAGGKVSYANRFLDSKAKRASDRGEVKFREFATDPCRSIFKRVMSVFEPGFTDNCNVNLVRLGEQFVAMTETPLPVEFDPDTLATRGVAFKPGGGVTTAHPHLDRATGELVNYTAKLGRRSTYQVYARSEDGSQRTVAVHGVREPAYMHSFAITERFAVLAEFPLVVDPLKLAVGNRPFIEAYRWRPERGTRFLVLDRRDGSVHADATSDPFFAFHHVNAWEDGDDVVLDLCAYEDAEVIRTLYLNRARGEEGTGAPRPLLTRFRVTPGESRVESRVLSDEPFELPRIDYARRNGQPYRHAYGIGWSEPGSGWFDQVVKVDTASGEARDWHEPGAFPGEPVFVAAPHGEEEDDGVLLSVVLDSHSQTSFLLVLDARTLAETARAQVPHHVPFGFHGQYFGGV